MCKVYTGYYGTSEIEHGLCACTVDNPIAKARGLSRCTGAQTMLYLSFVLPSSYTQSLARGTPYSARSTLDIVVQVIWSMVCAPVWSIIPLLKLRDYLSVQAHKPCSLTSNVNEIWNMSKLM